MERKGKYIKDIEWFFKHFTPETLNCNYNNNVATSNIRENVKLISNVI